MNQSDATPDGTAAPANTGDPILPALPEPGEVLASAAPRPPAAAVPAAAPAYEADLPVLPEPGAVLAGAPLPPVRRSAEPPPPAAAPAAASASQAAPAAAVASTRRSAPSSTASAAPARKSTTVVAPGSGTDLSGAIWGDFAIEQRLLCGESGSLYRARQSSVDRVVLLRILPAALYQSADHRRRFSVEARSAGRIASPHVLAFYDCGEHAGRLWSACEYVDGQDFSRCLRKGWQPEWRDALRLCAQAAQGLAAAHALGLVHGEITPDNLLLSANGQVKICGFDLPRPDRSGAGGAPAAPTSAGLAPEQVRGDAHDHRADIYALGCVLYELLCRHPVFSASSPAALREQHLRGEPRPPRSLAPWLPPAVEALALRMLDKDPAQRPQDAARLAQECELLSRVQAGEPPRQHRGPLVAAGITVVLGVAITFWWSTRPSPTAAAPADPPPIPLTPARAAPLLPPPAPTPASPQVEPAATPAPAHTPPPPAAIAPAQPVAPVQPAAPDIPAIERAAATLIATGEHLGPCEDLAKRLGPALRVERKGSSTLWHYGRYTFVIEDGLVLNVKQH